MIAFKENTQQLPPCVKQQPAVANPIQWLRPAVLVVEDQPAVQQGIQQLLAAFGISVTIANNGAQAMEKVQTEDYPLILMDLGLPDQDGRAIGKAIHRFQKQHRRPLSAIVAHSSQMNKKERRRCLSAGMLRAYGKPLTEENVQEVLELVGSSF